MALPLTGIMGLTMLASELTLAVRRRSGAAATPEDKGSLRLLWVVILVSVGMGQSLAWLGPPLPGAVPWPLIGLGVFMIGAAIRWWSIQHLGRFFTVDVAVANDHRVVQDGPYRWVRHPSYTGLLLEFLAIALVPGSWLAVGLTMLPIGAALWYRIRVEEAALLRNLGEPYAAYMRRTKRLVPGVL